MVNLRTLIIEDEPEAAEYLVSLIRKNCPDIEEIKIAVHFDSAIQIYEQYNPDLLFLDIEIGQKSGFDLLADLQAKGKHPYVIFVTGFDKYAIHAFRENAVDYLLKPVNPQELKIACHKFINLHDRDNYISGLRNLILTAGDRIRFNTREGFIFLNVQDILYLQADRNYSKIFLTNGSYETISQNLGKIGERLPPEHFIRISRSILVNMKYLYKIDRKRKVCELQNGDKSYRLPVSADQVKKQRF